MIEYTWTFNPDPSSLRTDNGRTIMTVDWVLTGTLNEASASLSGSGDMLYNPTTFANPDYVTYETIVPVIESNIGVEVVAQLKQDIENILT